MEIQRAPPSVSAQESLLPLDSKKDNDQSLCDRILCVLKSAFNHFVYFITCCQVDLRTKLVPLQPTLEYMQAKHNGEANKLAIIVGPENENWSAWYSNESGHGCIHTQKSDAPDFGFVYQFNPSTMQIDSIKSANKEQIHQHYNCEPHRGIFYSLYVTCKQAKPIDKVYTKKLKISICCMTFFRDVEISFGNSHQTARK